MPKLVKGRHYQQCELKNGQRVQVAWIPLRFAKIGAMLRIGEEEGWMVTSAYATRQGEPTPTVLESIESREHGK